MPSGRVPSRREVGRALVASVRGDQDTLRRHVERFGTTSLERAGWRHGVEGLLDLALEAVGASTDSSRAGRLGAAVQHARTLSLLGRVGAALDRDDVPFLTVKGPVLAGYYYERSDLRRYVDLDLLVAPELYPTALDVLNGAGFVVHGDWDTLRAELAGELRLQSGESIVDLHWTLVDDTAARSRLSLPTSAVLSARRTVRLGPLLVPTTHPDHTVLHVALHAALSGAARLVWLVDLDRVLRREEHDWEGVLRVARAGGMGPQVGLVLGRARQVMDAPVPTEVLAALAASPVWRGFVSLVDRAFPVGTARTDASPARLVVRATRGSAAASLATMSRNVGSLLPAPRRARGVGVPPGAPDSARARYLAAVLGQE